MADRVVANSTAVRDWLVGLGMDERRVVTIPNGIVVPSEPRLNKDGSVRRQLGIPPDAPVIAAVCRLNQNKGLEYFLRAAVALRPRFPEARFLIVGGSYFDPLYPKTLEQLTTQLGLNDRVIFAGERNDVPRVLQEIDISVLPSLNEGLSNSLLEAMAAGLPVVATRVGGNPEVVQHGKTGLLVPPRDPQALAEAITRILESPEMSRQFGRAGFDRVKDNFSLAATVRRTEDLYMSLLDRSRPAMTA
jgi:glycosyltransferase involved in cell wall biosynthesis